MSYIDVQSDGIIGTFPKEDKSFCPFEILTVNVWQSNALTP
jgi:hypothetical protein